MPTTQTAAGCCRMPGSGPLFGSAAAGSSGWFREFAESAEGSGGEWHDRSGGCDRLVVRPDAAAIFFRCPAATSGAARVGHAWQGRGDLLHHDVVPPVVAEVIDVDDLRLLLRSDLGKRHRSEERPVGKQSRYG